jgi:hypothetical protein
MREARVTMGAQGFLRAAREKGVVARLTASDGTPVAIVGPRGSLGEPDVVARELPGNACEIRAGSLAGQLFLSVLTAGG